MSLFDTGERILLDKETPLMISRHLCAYRFAKYFVFNKRVLDIGSGEGYGSNYLAEFAKEVVGIDYDKTIIDYSKNKYKRDNLLFRPVDINDLGTLNDEFEAVCAFQVIEHIVNAKEFLNNVRKLLKDNGMFICSTPNRQDASPHSEVPFNKFHVKEYLSDDFSELLKMHFKKVEMHL